MVDNAKTPLIGQRIRQIRNEQGLTLNVMTEKTGLSTPYLSQIENGHANLNVVNLEAIAQALKVPVVTFFENTNTRKISINRQSERRWFDLGDKGQASKALLLMGVGNMEIFTIEMPAGSDPVQDSNLRGEEFTYVTKGAVQITLDNQQIYDLEEGDIIYYHSDIPHFWQNVSDIDSEILVFYTPATNYLGHKYG